MLISRNNFCLTNWCQKGRGDSKGQSFELTCEAHFLFASEVHGPDSASRQWLPWLPLDQVQAARSLPLTSFIRFLLEVVHSDKNWFPTK